MTAKKCGLFLSIKRAFTSTCYNCPKILLSTLDTPVNAHLSVKVFMAIFIIAKDQNDNPKKCILVSYDKKKLRETIVVIDDATQ